MKLSALLMSIVLLLAVALSGLHVQRETAQQAISQTSTNVQSDRLAEDTLQMAYSEAIGGDDAAYHFQRDSAGYTATNPPHNLTIDISEDTVEISVSDDVWLLSSEQFAADFTLADNRLTLHRDGYDEWYVNGPVGLQQGFTLYEPSKVVFKVGGTLTTTAGDHTLQIGDAFTFSGLMAYDANGDSVPVAFELEGNKLVYAYDDTGAEYPLTIDPWVQQAKLLASDGASGDLFGWSVAVDGDTALIGALGDACATGLYCGSAYVFVRSGSTWSQQQKLTAADGADGDFFGSSVSLSGDTALIGADGDEDSGSAYVFTRTGSIWSQQQKLTATDADTGERFGFAVSLSGDTALIGAPHEFDNDGTKGSAYVFTRVIGTWSQQQKLTAADGADGDDFGWSVAIDGDTALIGAHRDDDNGSDSGSAYVFSRSGSSWTQQQKLTASDADAGDDFGSSVAVDGDTALIGAYGDDDNGSDSGSAYVFSRSGSSWTQQQKLTASDADAGDDFGSSVAVDGDTALVGADNDSCAAGPGCGSAYVFTRSGSTWAQQQKLTAVDADDNDQFGYSVGLSGDTTLIGAFGDEDNGLGSGTAYIFFFATPPVASASCNAENLVVTISAGDGPFNITASAGVNTPVNGVSTGMTTINGPEKWDDLTVTETTGDLQSINLGQFRCRSDERPIPTWPAHRSHTTSMYPLFSWTSITNANNYRMFVFDDANPATRTVDIRQNSGGPTSMQLSTPLPDGRLFWRVRGRQNRIWSLWSTRFTLFKDPIVPFSASTPVPTIDFSPPSGDGSVPSPLPTPPAPPNSR